MQKIVFSFVILTFNSDKFISECLSAIGKAIADLKIGVEVYIVDNGSKDNTRRVLQEFEFDNYVAFTAILLGKSRGTTYSRNIALKQSSGEFVVILDSDAYVNSDVLESPIGDP
jgi:glycosyltransferase involved in cell wall biosynthesis